MELSQRTAATSNTPTATNTVTACASDASPTQLAVKLTQYWTAPTLNTWRYHLSAKSAPSSTMQGRPPGTPCTKRNKEIFFSGGSHNTHPAAVHARVWTPVGTGLSMPRDRAITARPVLAGRQRRLMGHKYLRNKLSHRDVSSCRFFL